MGNTTSLPQMPTPWQHASVFAAATSLSSAPSCTATFSADELQLLCQGEPIFVATTTVPYLVPCLGCATLATAATPYPCNEGAPPDHTRITWPTTVTYFTPQCSPTPDPDEFNRPDVPVDFTTTMTYTDYIPGKPEFTPVSLIMTSWAQGYCKAYLEVYPTYNPYNPSETHDSAYYSSLSSLTTELCATPTVTSYTATAHVTSSVDCAGCASPVSGLSVATYNKVYCEYYYPTTTSGATVSRPTVTATTAYRDVLYACQDDYSDRR